jgi:hypothetical protein
MMKDFIKLAAAEVLYKPHFRKADDVYDKLNREGIYVIPNFISDLRAAELRRLAEECLSSNPDLIKEESNGFDERIYGVDRFTDFRVPELDELANNYARKFYFGSKLYSFLLMGRITAGEENQGSGSGWHRDSPFTHQFKTILYLTDVEENNGPFQFIKGSHKVKSVKESLKFLRASGNKRRFTVQEVDSLIENRIVENYTTYNAKKGTAILVNTRGLHRGAPLSEGNRYALTKYYSTKEFSPNFFKT